MSNTDRGMFLLLTSDFAYFREWNTSVAVIGYMHGNMSIADRGMRPLQIVECVFCKQTTEFV